MSGFGIAILAIIGIIFLFTQSEGSGVGILATFLVLGLGAYAIVRGFSK